MTMTPEETTLLSAMHGSVRVLTLHRPASLNSFTAQMNVELRVALEDAAAAHQLLADQTNFGRLVLSVR